MSIEQMPDERLAHFYENIRQQVSPIAGKNINSPPVPPSGSMPKGCEARWSNGG